MYKEMFCANIDEKFEEKRKTFSDLFLKNIRHLKLYENDIEEEHD